MKFQFNISQADTFLNLMLHLNDSKSINSLLSYFHLLLVPRNFSCGRGVIPSLAELGEQAAQLMSAWVLSVWNVVSWSVVRHLV
jgi:hypothetical protein